MIRTSRAAGGPRATGLLVARGATRLACGLALGLTAVVALVGPAVADDAGLSFAPGAGQDVTPMYVVTSGPCPEPATNVIATATGRGFGPQGQVVISNSTSGVSHTTAFVLPLQDTMHGFAALNRTTLSGPYVVTLRCVNRLQTQELARFSGTITFSSPTRFTAPEPSAAVQRSIEGAAAARPAASSAATPSAAPIPTPSPRAVAPSDGPVTGSRIVVVGGGIALVLLGALTILRDRRPAVGASHGGHTAPATPPEPEKVR